MTRLTLVGALLALAALVGVFAWALIGTGGQRELPSALIGKTLPDFSLPPLEGREGDKGLSLADLKTGRPSLVNVWASWCPPCRAEHPLLAEFARETGVALNAINYKDKPQDALAYLIELGDPYALVGRDESGRTAIDWGVYGVPETFVIDGEGRVVARVAGPLSAYNIKHTIEPALRAAAAH